MSTEAQPISAAQFAQAIEDLPLENIYGKAYEIKNSISHLQQSNKVLQEYSDSIKEDSSIDSSVRANGDADCLDAIQENEVVVERQWERMRLLKAEVERRGQLWHEADPGKKDETINGNGHAQEPTTNGGGLDAPAQPQPSGRLTDEELRQQVENLYSQDEGDSEDGMHL